MTKTYCDFCGNEMSYTDLKKLTGSYDNFYFEVVTSSYGNRTGGHFCHQCIRQAVAGQVLGKPAKEANG